MRRMNTKLLHAICALLPLLASGPAFANKVVVQYRTWLDPSSPNPRSIAQSKIIEEFNRAHSDIEVQTQLVPWQEMHTSIIRDTAAGAAPCLVRPFYETIPQIVSAGALMPLDRLAEDAASAQKQDYLLDWNSTVFDGHKMSFPLEHRVLLLLYRKDLFEQARLQPPKTWDEFVSAAKQLSGQGVIGSSVGLAAKGSAEGFFQWLFPYVWGYGDDFFDKSGQATVTPGLVRAMNFLREGVHTHKFLSPSIVSDDVEVSMQAFMAGRVAMIVLGSNRVGNVLQSKQIQGKLGLARIPSPDPTRPSPTIVSGWQIAITKDCKTPEAAWKFINHITSPEMMLVNSKIGGELPTRKSVLNDPWFASEDAAVARLAAEYMAEAGRPQMLLPTFTAFTTTLAIAAQKIVGQSAPVEETLKDAMEKYNAKAASR